MLPAGISTFVGRGAETAAVRDLLRARRLVTVKGAAGIGKTRFAEHVAGVVEGDFADGVVHVPLADVRAAGLAGDLARALDLVDNGGSPTTALLTGYLRDKRLLLVLDNCEHLVEDADDPERPGPLPQLVHLLLRAAEGVRVLATSRLPLGVGGEHVVDLGPLPHLSDGDEEPDALVLLRDRLAAKGKPLLPEHEPSAREVCVLLEGVPHAIEMVAALRRHKTWAELLAGLRADLALLAQGRLPEVDQWHHRTLRASMQLTHQLLDEPARRLWVVLSVFTGVADLDAVRDLAALLGGGDAARVEALLETLVDHSVLIHTELDGRSLWRMLPTVRAFGLHADPELAARARLAHAEHHAALVARIAESCYAPDEVPLLRALDAALPNIRTAVATLVATGQGERALRLLVDLSDSRANTFTGTLGELRRLMTMCLDALGDQVLPGVVECMAGGAFAALIQGEGLDAARPVLQRCHELLRELPPGAEGVERAVRAVEWAEATARWIAEPDPAVAAGSIDPLRRLAAAEPNPVRRHLRFLFAGFAAAYYRHPDARDLARDHLADTLAAGAPWAGSWARWLMALVAFVCDEDPDEALVQLKVALREQHDMGDRWGPPWTVWLMALAAGSRGEHATAGLLLGGAWAQQRAISTDVTGLTPNFRLQQRVVDLCVARLGRDAWAQRTAAGARLSLDDLVDQALALPERGGVVHRRQFPAGLTRREFEALLRLAADFPATNEAMAARMACGKRTFETYLQEVRRKTGITDRYELATYGRQWLPAGQQP
ncbi:ATP-binding protein [Saccharothrix variisporea]|uniref:Putative ATPase n=1 Tax=Saccharothrix variisporea TaxID=543527 RepID=A0A495XE54_9PSEU|nr:NACHT domain-containing protein [Saccharothrix variisporea]RKT72731.1 putative ATPase [Saccharothrix variisporea]